MRGQIIKTPIKNFNNVILGYIEEDSEGNQRARDFYNRILGTYDKKSNITKDFYGRILGRGNLLSGLIFNKK